MAATQSQRTLHGRLPIAEPAAKPLSKLAHRFGGVVVPLVTPCQTSGALDTDAMSRLCSTLAQQGCNGLFVGGSTGELPLLDEDDRRTITATARTAVPEETIIYAGVTGTGCKQTLRYARNAAQDGADAAVVMAPFFLKLGQPELLHYFREIADHSPIPVVLYHHPRAATSIEPDTIAALSEHANIVAMKDTSGTLERARAVIAAVPAGALAVLQGTETLIKESLQMGATGMVSALAHIAPDWHAELYAAMQAGNDARADEMQERISHLWKIFHLEPVGVSIAAFTYLLRVSLEHRGWLTNADGVVSGFVPTDHFRRSILKHLEDCEVPAAVSA